MRNGNIFYNVKTRIIHNLARNYYKIIFKKKKKRKSFLISFPQIKFSPLLINRINVRYNEYRVQSTEKYQRLDSAPFPFPLRKDQNPRAYFSKSDRNSNSLWGWKKRVGTGFGRVLSGDKFTSFPVFRDFGPLRTASY